MKKPCPDGMKVGVKYYGYAMINEFREIMFTPSQKGANEGRQVMVVSGDGWSVSTTRENIVIHVKTPRCDNMTDRLKNFLAIQDRILKVLMEYDLSNIQRNKKK